MTKRKGFTLIELLVVIAIIALLMAVLMPTLQKVRKQAKNVICQTRLKQWGAIFAAYTGSHNSSFMMGKFPTDDPGLDPDTYINNHWLNALEDYYDMDSGISLCPVASKVDAEGGKGIFRAWGWGVIPAAWWPPSNCRGSYGSNDWILNHPPGRRRSSHNDPKNNWRTTNVKRPNEIPIFLDCISHDACPKETDEPPEFNGDTSWGIGTSEMRTFFIDRHDKYTNSLFMDFSVRKVGLKELYKLRWHRSFDVNGAWTMAYNLPPDWKGWGTGWLASYKDY